MPSLTGFFLIVTVLMSYISMVRTGGFHSQLGLMPFIISLAVLTGESQKLVAVVGFVWFLYFETE